MSSSTSKVGYVRRAHGIKGAVIVRALGGEAARFVPGGVLLTDDDRFPSLEVETAQTHKEGLLVKFAGVADRNVAETLRGVSFLVTEDQRRKLDEDEYWPEDLIDLTVIGPDGGVLGTVSDVVVGEAQDRLVVATTENLVEVPFVAAIVTEVDVPAGRLVVEPPEGLF